MMMQTIWVDVQTCMSDPPTGDAALRRWKSTCVIKIDVALPASRGRLRA